MTVQYLKLFLVQQTSFFTFTHQYLIQKSSFGKTCNAKKKGQVAVSVTKSTILLSVVKSLYFGHNQFLERQTTVFHFCDEF
jgi:hypothetical protein